MINKALYVFFISMLPIIELRGAIPYGIAMGLPIYLTYIIAVIGNIIPVPFLIIFAKKILDWMSTSNITSKLAINLKLKNKSIRFSIQDFCIKIIKKADEKASKIGKYELLGLFFFVAIPIPGTGAWTGSLIAATLRLRLIPSVISISLGVLSSGIIMSIISWLWNFVSKIFI